MSHPQFPKGHDQIASLATRPAVQEKLIIAALEGRAASMRKQIDGQQQEVEILQRSMGVATEKQLLQVSP